MGGWENGLDVLRDQLLETLHDNGSKCFRLIQLLLDKRGFVGTDIIDVALKRWDNGLAQGNVEDICKDILELFSTVLQNTARKVVWSSCFECVDSGDNALDNGRSQTYSLFTWERGGFICQLDVLCWFQRSQRNHLDHLAK